MYMDNIQMLKRKYILRGWIDKRVTPDLPSLYSKLMTQRHSKPLLP
jgi:hypothetical protein